MPSLTLHLSVDQLITWTVLMMPSLLMVVKAEVIALDFSYISSQ